jgi:superfamily II DNA/RNA helicase
MVGKLAAQILTRQRSAIEVASHTDSHDNIEQRCTWADDLQHKHRLLEQLLTEREMEQAVIFTSTQRDADELAAHLATTSATAWPPCTAACRRVAATRTLHGAAPR